MKEYNFEKYEAKFIERGEKLYKQKKVYLRKKIDGGAIFYVYGTQIYSVRVDFEKDKYFCGCYHRGGNPYCKHEIAVQFYLRDVENGVEPLDGGLRFGERTFYSFEEFRALLTKINRRYKKKGFIAYWDGYAWGKEIDDLLYECEYLLQFEEEGVLAVACMGDVLGNTVKNWGNIDDDGTLVPLINYCTELLIQGKRFIDAPLKDKIKKLIEKSRDNDAYEYLEDLLLRLE